MTCTTTLTVNSAESFEEPALGSSYGTFDCSAQKAARIQRRHSSYQPQQWSIDTDDIQVLLDRFLSQLGKRLDFFDRYGSFKIDTSLDCAYSTLRAVHDSCAHVSDEVIDAGWRRARVFVETLEERYRDALARKQTMEQKAREGVRLMESVLADLETRAYEVRASTLGAFASDVYQTGKKHLQEGVSATEQLVDEGIERAKSAKEVLKAKVDNALSRAKEHGLITFHDLPEPWRNNPHILKGYRFCETNLDCIRSCFYFSNETVNIWSHAIGLVIVLSIAFYFYPTSPYFASSTNADTLVAAVFFFAACKCLVCSTMWHTMSSISSQTILDRFACVDYTGISLLVAASIMTTEYTAFYCEPVSRWTYMTMTALLGLGGVILPWHPTFNRADMSWARVGFYVSLAATGAIPVAQIVMSRGLDWAMYFYAPITKSVCVYLAGAFMYAAKVPERFFPGAFDYCGGSHNIWHLAVLGGILFHYSAMQSFFGDAFRRAEGQCSVY